MVTDMIIRAPRPENHFTVLRNDLLRNRRLSFKARGLLAFMLSYPDDWQFSIERLQTEHDGRHAITTALAELEQAGHLIRRRRRRLDGTFTTDLIIYDNPQGNVNDLWTTDPSTTGYPTRETGTSIEDCETKTVQTVSTRSSVAGARLCGHCKGAGVQLHANDDIGPCHRCGGSGIQ